MIVLFTFLPLDNSEFLMKGITTSILNRKTSLKIKYILSNVIYSFEAAKPMVKNGSHQISSCKRKVKSDSIHKDVSFCNSLSQSRCCTPARLSQQYQSTPMHHNHQNTILADNISKPNKVPVHYHSTNQLATPQIGQNNHNHKHRKSSPSDSLKYSKNDSKYSSQLGVTINLGQSRSEVRPSFCKENSSVRATSTNVSNSTRITKMLLIVSFCFIILNSPYRAAILISQIHMLIRGVKINHFSLIFIYFLLFYFY